MRAYAPYFVYALYAVVAVLSVYAWRDWFTSLCGMIVLVAFIAHPRMPRTIMDIQGLTPWNVLYFSVFVAWLARRRHEGLTWDMPRYMKLLLLGYVVIFLIAFLRLIVDRDSMIAFGYRTSDLVSERLINTIKWVIPGMLIYDGCRTQKRLVMVTCSICLVYVLVAMQVIHYSPIRGITQVQGVVFDRLELGEDIGLHPAMLGKMFAGGAWAILAASLLFRRKLHKLCAFGAFLIVTAGQAFVVSRSGFLAWGLVGFAMCLIRWRRGLWAMPIVVALFFLLLPGASARLTSGFGETDETGDEVRNERAITSGRNLIWPYVLEKVADAPLIGYGRDAMRRTGLTNTLNEYVGRSEAVTHAHNAYLDLLLESGLIGLSVVMGFYGVVVFQSARLFRVRGNPSCAAAGGVAFALVVSHLAASIGSESFFPQEGDFGVWCAIGLMLRVVRATSRSRLSGSASVNPEALYCRVASEGS